MGSLNLISRQIKAVFQEEAKLGKRVMAMAMNKTIKEVKEDLKDEMKKVFNEPTPFVLNSFWLKFASEEHLIVSVEIKDKWGSGATEVISPHIEGGSRPAKSSERRLRETGSLSSNRFYVPGSGVKVNKYGNIPGPKIVQILSAASAFTDAGYDANRTTNSIKRNPNQSKYFVIKDGSKSHLKPGVYYRTGKGDRNIKPILIFINSPHYNIRFMFFELSEKFYRAKLVNNISYAYTKLHAKGTT